MTAEIIAHCIAVHPECELTMEVRDEWYSLRELDYTVTMKARSNPVIKALEELQRCDATKILLTNYAHTELFIQSFGQRVNVIVTDSSTVMQIMPLGASKENAVAKLCRSWGLDTDSVIVFGDDYNDVGMFRSFGYAVAMGNAINELKELAHETTAANDEDGVAAVLERLVGGETNMLK